jgi:hypothetical protein
MYVPNEEISVVFAKLKAENSRLKLALEDSIQESIRKVNEKNREIEGLKSQLTRVPSSPPSHRIVHVREGSESREKKMSKEYTRVEQPQTHARPPNPQNVQQMPTGRSKQAYESLIGTLTDKLVSLQLQQLNSKYKSKYF